MRLGYCVHIICNKIEKDYSSDVKTEWNNKINKKELKQRIGTSFWKAIQWKMCRYFKEVEKQRENGY